MPALSYRILTPPTVEPVVLADMKAYLNVDFPDSDTLIQSFISYARRYAEKVTKRALAPQTIQCTIEPPMIPEGELSGPIGGDFDAYRLNERITTVPFGFYGPSFALPFSPVISVSTVEYQLTPFDGQPATGMQWTTLAAVDDNNSANYLLDTNTDPMQIVLRPLLVANRYRFTYQAGYGDVSTGAPSETVVDAIKALCSWRFDNRQGQDIPQSITESLARERIYTL
jgi:hypothetical protein